ncbi:MAG TPA: HAD hydrolase family protein [Gammaproteobacteria bacterium]|nr:HAD hydrolase family protein [Gammaproteobacteria bacterium]
MSEDARKRAARVRLAVFDVDGVLTDGMLTYDDRGIEYKSFHTQDGLGLKLLQQAGVTVAVISARNSDIVTRRMRELGIKHVYQGSDDKLSVLRELLRSLKVDGTETAYTGDDLPDVPPMRLAGFAVAVQNAVAAVRQYAHWITSKPGGQGAAREICDFILSAQGKLAAVTAAAAGDAPAK